MKHICPYFMQCRVVLCILKKPYNLETKNENNRVVIQHQDNMVWCSGHAAREAQEYNSPDQFNTYAGYFPIELIEVEENI